MLISFLCLLLRVLVVFDNCLLLACFEEACGRSDCTEEGGGIWARTCFASDITVIAFFPCCCSPGGGNQETWGGVGMGAMLFQRCCKPPSVDTALTKSETTDSSASSTQEHHVGRTSCQRNKYVLTTPYYYDHNTRSSRSSPTPRDSKKGFHPSKHSDGEDVEKTPRSRKREKSIPCKRKPDRNERESKETRSGEENRQSTTLFYMIGKIRSRSLSLSLILSSLLLLSTVQGGKGVE